MKIYLATDHAGLSLKEKVKHSLLEAGYDVEDCGAHVYDGSDDYPDFISKAAKAVSENPQNSRGILFGGSGQGEAMVANKFRNVRCALFYAPRIPPHATDIEGTVSEDPYELLKLTRTHNDSNMLSLGARLLTDEEVLRAIIIWLETPFPGDSRHIRRIEKIKEIEKRVQQENG